MPVYAGLTDLPSSSACVTLANPVTIQKNLMYTPMKNSRFYHPDSLSINTEIQLTPETSHHISTVLRMKAGDAITLFCGDGSDYHGQIIETHKKKTIVKLFDEIKLQNESPLKIHLAQAICRGEKMDFVIQKATELGVTEITPIICERTQGARDMSKLAKKQDHWQKVMISACEQSGRAVLPTLNPTMKFNDFAIQCSTGEKIIMHTDTKTRPQVIFAQAGTGMTDENDNFTITIGPEGGFTDIEVHLSLDNNYKAQLLGPRILRTETAALAMISVLQFNHGDFIL